MRLPAGVQPKLTIGAVHDPAEMEADRVADQIMRMPSNVLATSAPPMPPTTPNAPGAPGAPTAPGPPSGGTVGRTPSIINRKCKTCDDDKVQRKPTQVSNFTPPVIRMKASNSSSGNVGGGIGGSTASPASETAINGLGAGRPLPAAERAFFEPRFGRDLSAVRIHTDTAADKASRSINARAFTLGNNIAFAKGEYSTSNSASRHLMAHELTHTVQQGSGVQRVVRRAMKFEFQLHKNKLYRWDTVKKGKPTPLPRKFGFGDFITKGFSGVRLESETGGQIEFETGWKRKWSDLYDQVTEAMEMVNKISSAPEPYPSPSNGVKYKKFPFNIDHLKSGNQHGSYEKKAYENKNETKLGKNEILLVTIGSRDWSAYIQTSESMLLKQYGSLMDTYEHNKYHKSTTYDPSTKKYKKNYDKIWPYFDNNTAIKLLTADIFRLLKADSKKFENLENFLFIIVSYIIRGQYPAAIPTNAAGKYIFSIMSRTHLGSVYKTLSLPEQNLFKKFVVNSNSYLLNSLSLTKKSKFFPVGQGSKGLKNPASPTIGEWLSGLSKGKDKLSSREANISAASGKFKIDEEVGKHGGLMRFEVRFSKGNTANSKDWLSFVKERFDLAISQRPRKNTKGKNTKGKNAKGKTKLVYDFKAATWFGGEVFNSSDREWLVSGRSNSKKRDFHWLPAHANSEDILKIENFLGGDVDAIWPAGGNLKNNKNNKFYSTGVFKISDINNTDITGSNKTGYQISDFATYHPDSKLPSGWKLPISFIAQKTYTLSISQRKRMQRTLTKLGLYTHLIDADIGDGTKAAIRAWYKSKGEKFNGVIDDALYQRIMRG